MWNLFAGGHVERDVSSLFEAQGQRKNIAVFQRLCEANKHDMKAAGLQFYGVAHWYLDTAFYPSHAHDLAIADMGMQLGSFGDVRACTDQHIVLFAMITNGKKTCGIDRPAKAHTRYGAADDKGAPGALCGGFRSGGFMMASLRPDQGDQNGDRGQKGQSQCALDCCQTIHLTSSLCFAHY